MLSSASLSSACACNGGMRCQHIERRIDGGPPHVELLAHGRDLEPERPDDSLQSFQIRFFLLLELIAYLLEACSSGVLDALPARLHIHNGLLHLLEAGGFSFTLRAEALVGLLELAADHDYLEVGLAALGHVVHVRFVDHLKL